MTTETTVIDILWNPTSWLNRTRLLVQLQETTFNPRSSVNPPC